MNFSQHEIVDRAPIYRAGAISAMDRVFLNTPFPVLAFFVGAVCCIASTQLFTAYQIRRWNNDPHRDAMIHFWYGVIAAWIGLVLVTLAVYRLAL